MGVGSIGRLTNRISASTCVETARCVPTREELETRGRGESGYIERVRKESGAEGTSRAAGSTGNAMISRKAAIALALAFGLYGFRGTGFAFDGPRSSDDFAHALEFDVEGEIPSVEGAADGWEETAWNFGQAPNLSVSGGNLHFDSFSAAGTAAGTPWIHMDGGSAWESEVTGATSYTLEMSAQVTAAIGGMIVWAGNGGNRLILRVGTNSITADGTGEIDTGDNSAGQVALRVAYDGGASTYDIYRDGVLIGDDLPASGADGNNRLILFDCCGSTAAAGQLGYLRWSAGVAADPGTDSSTFDHALEFETDDELPSVEGAADGWAEVNGWNIPGNPPTLEVAGGNMSVRTVGVGGGHDVRQPVDTSAWAMEVDPGTSYTFETRLRVVNEGGASPGFSIWLGNGTAAETHVVQVRSDSLSWGTNTVIHEGDNQSDFITVRIAHDGATGLATVWRNGIQVATDLGAGDIQSGNNWIILVDFGGANEIDADVDYVRWDATGAFEPAGDGRDASTFAHKLTFDVDGEIPSVEGAADGWQETAWNFGQAPNLSVSGGNLNFNTFSSAGTAAGTPWIHMDGGSAWESEVTGATSYTLEMSVQVTAAIGGMIVWAGNGGNRLILRVGTGSITADGTGELDTGDNSAGQIALRIAYDGGASTYDIYREGVLIGDDLPASGADGNNRLILFDCCGSTASEGQLGYLRWTAAGALDLGTDSSTFDHALEFETDGELPSVEGAADGWAEVNGWNIPGNPPTLEVAGGNMSVRTVGVGGGHDVRQPVDTSAWAMEVDPGTSYTFETRLRVIDEGGSAPGFSIWLGNGTAAETHVVQVRSGSLSWGSDTVIHEGDNQSDFVTVRIGHDGATGLATVWRNGIQVATDLGAGNIQSANNWVILVDFGGANEIDADVDYVCWDAGGIFAPPSGGSDEDPPAAPQNLVATGGVGGVALDWDSNTEDDLAGYNVSRSEVSGGPYEPLASGVSASAFVDDTTVDGVEYCYIVTAFDASDNESEASTESCVTPGFGAEREPDTFAHCLDFNTDGELPDVEGAATGWVLDGAWNETEGVPPTMTVSGGLMQFETVAGGQQSISLNDGASMWSDLVDGSTSYTFEVSVRPIATTGGVIIWLANGTNRFILRVDTNSVSTFDDVILNEANNTARQNTIRVGYDGVSQRYFVWRNGILIGNDLAPHAATGRTAVFLIDCCSSVTAEGEMDYVCFDTTGLYPPASIVDETAPEAPLGVVAVGGVGAVGLDWDANSEDDLAGYNVYRSETTGGPYDLISEGQTGSAFSDANVVNGVTYFYVVTAVDGSQNESNSSDETSGTPEDPSELAASQFAHKLGFNENGMLPSVEGAADGWAEDASWNQNDPDPPTLNVFGGRLIFDSLLAGQHAITMQAESAWANEIDAATSYTAEVRVRVTASEGDNSGAVLWFANGSTRFILRVDRDATYIFGGEQIDAEDNSADFVTFRIGYDAVGGRYFVWRDGLLIGDGLPATGAAAGGRTAVFLIDCCSSVQVSGELDYVCWTANGIYGPDTVAPGAPSGLVATGGEGEVSLDWNDNPEGDVLGYDVLRAESAGGPYSVVASLVAASEYVDSDVVNDITYYYVVAAIDTSFNASDNSGEESATPADVTGPVAPTGFVATAGDSEVALDWNDNSEDDLASYTVKRSESSGGPYDVLASDVLASELVDDSALNDVTYFYVVVAVDTSGNASDDSDEVSATPLNPGGLQVPGDCNADGTVNVSDAICLFGFLFGGGVSELPCGDGSDPRPRQRQLGGLQRRQCRQHLRRDRAPELLVQRRSGAPSR